MSGGGGSAGRGTGRDVVGLVLSGGGARGAYEMGVLSVLAPVLEARGERPAVIVGTSAGALNTAFLAAEAVPGRPLSEVVERGVAAWRATHYGDVLGPVASPRPLRRALQYGLEVLGVPGARLSSLLDSTPQERTLRRRIRFEQIRHNVDAGVLRTAAVVATSYRTNRSVVFHHGGATPPRDVTRGIDYVPVELDDEHVLASSAMQALFPAVWVSAPADAAGWYGDGGTRLNTPLKPALQLGADRLLVIGLNAVGGQPHEGRQRRTDVFDGLAQILQALLADQLAHDVATLATFNRSVLSHRPSAGAEVHGRRHRVVPYIFVAPRGRYTVGRIASDVYRSRYTGAAGLRRSRDLALLGRALGAGRDAARGDLFSYVFFAPEFFERLLEQGREDAERWLATVHDDGPWRLGHAHPTTAGAAPRDG